MPPKAAAEAAPAEEPEEDTGPKESPEEWLAKRLGMTPHPQEQHVEMLLERSSGISSDPKMKMLSSSISSPKSKAEPASLVAGRSRCALRTGGTAQVERRVRELELGHRQRPPIGASPGRFAAAMGLGSSASAPQLRRMDSAPVASPLTSPTGADTQKGLQMQYLERFDSAHHRSQLRESTDDTLKRLLMDVDFANTNQQKNYAHQSRCNHVDKMHGWYSAHNYKDKADAQKEKKTQNPPYLLFSQEGPVSPGSLRVQFKHPSPLLERTLRHTGSSSKLDDDDDA